MQIHGLLHAEGLVLPKDGRKQILVKDSVDLIVYILEDLLLSGRERFVRFHLFEKRLDIIECGAELDRSVQIVVGIPRLHLVRGEHKGVSSAFAYDIPLSVQDPAEEGAEQGDNERNKDHALPAPAHSVYDRIEIDLMGSHFYRASFFPRGNSHSIKQHRRKPWVSSTVLQLEFINELV